MTNSICNQSFSSDYVCELKFLFLIKTNTTFVVSVFCMFASLTHFFYENYCLLGYLYGVTQYTFLSENEVLTAKYVPKVFCTIFIRKNVYTSGTQFAYQIRCSNNIYRKVPFIHIQAEKFFVQKRTLRTSTFGIIGLDIYTLQPINIKKVIHIFITLIFDDELTKINIRGSVLSKILI